MTATTEPEPDNTESRSRYRSVRVSEVDVGGSRSARQLMNDRYRVLSAVVEAADRGDIAEVLRLARRLDELQKFSSAQMRETEAGRAPDG